VDNLPVFFAWFAGENQCSVGSFQFGSSASERAEDLSPLRRGVSGAKKFCDIFDF
jgi:hypothetical protein